MKIHILGGPGSGKTTLAQALPARFHIPHYDLDLIHLEPESAVALAEQSAWITEGIYLIVTEPMLYHADYIVLLATPWPIAAARIIRRHILNSLRGTQAYPGINGVKLLLKLLKYARQYYVNQEHTDKTSIEVLHNYLKDHQEIATPPTEAFAKQYLETYREFVAPPDEQFSHMYLDLDRYKKRVFLLKNRTDRERLLELLTQVSQA
ncbi:MAG: hypothetical protein H0U76_07575 [Ktedonobacteraceae bacterium]|nr:hypothetical protein [Ktedonobacteraceae bacterium]